MKIRKFQTGGAALASAAATGGTISLTELMAPYFSSAATKLFSLTPSAAPAATAVAIPVALTASGVYGAKANQKQVEKGMMPFITSPHAALGYQQTYMNPKKEMTVPSEPLVLRPEYRTETTVLPENYVNPLKAITEVTDAAGVRHFVDTANLYRDPDQVPDPKKDDKDKKPFWKSTPGKALKWGIGIGIGGATAPWAIGGIYKYFHDYVPYAIGKTIKDNSNSELKDSDIRELE